ERSELAVRRRPYAAGKPLHGDVTEAPETAHEHAAAVFERRFFDHHSQYDGIVFDLRLAFDGRIFHDAETSSSNQLRHELDQIIRFSDPKVPVELDVFDERRHERAVRLGAELPRGP